MMRKARNTHSAVVVEVPVDEEVGMARVARVVNAVAAGRIINPQAARSQIIGASYSVSAGRSRRRRWRITASAVG